MDYILQLREYIGHRPILMVGAAVFVLDKQDRLLMMKRSDSGLWGSQVELRNRAKWLKKLPGARRSKKPT